MKLLLKDFCLLSLEEHNKMLNIRNSEYIKKNMKTKSIIRIEDHLKWIKKLKNDLNNIYYAAFYNDIMVGAIYITEIDYILKESTWGLYFKQNINPFISSFCTYTIINQAFINLGLEELKLEVNKNNIAAYKFDLTFGFNKYDEKVESNEEYYLMKMNKDYWLSMKENGVLRLINQKLSKINLQIKGKK